MSHDKITAVLATVLALSGMIACDGDKNTPPPQTAADQTTTTSASAVDPSSQHGAPSQSSLPTQRSQTSTAAGGATSTSGISNPVDSPPRSPPIAGDTSSINSTAGISATTAAASASGGGSDSSALSDAQIVSVVQTADTGEIAQAREALRKGKNARVRHFAQHMVDDHSAAETKLSSIDSKVGITPQTSAVAEQVKSSGEQVMSSLKSSPPADFDKTYIDAQVQEHTDVLDILDNKLIPRAQNTDLAKALHEIRGKVASHLREAQDIQGSLKTP